MNKTSKPRATKKKTATEQQQQLNTKLCLTTCFSLFLSAFIKIHSHFFFRLPLLLYFILCPSISFFLSFFFCRVFWLLWNDTLSQNRIQSLTHSFVHSFTRTHLTHHSFNTVFVVVGFHLPEKKKFIRNEHSQNTMSVQPKRERNIVESNCCKCIRDLDIWTEHSLVRTT